MGRMLLLLLLACGYRDCGELRYYTWDVDPRFDDDGDHYLDLMEACGVDYGSFAFDYQPEGYTAIFVDPSEWDLGDAADVVYDYLPTTEIVFRTDHLVAGERFGMEALAGFGLHKPGGPADLVTTTFFLSDGSVEVLDGPRPNNFDGVDWKLRLHLVFGDVAEPATEGWQVLDLTDWINSSPALGSWAESGSTIISPPDAG